MENLTVIIANMKVSEKAYSSLKTSKRSEAGKVSICAPMPLWVAVISNQREPDIEILP